MAAAAMAFVILYVTAFGPFCGLAHNFPATEGAVRVAYQPLAWIANRQPAFAKPLVRNFLDGYSTACDGGDVVKLVFGEIKRG